jgi:hypothetical protein
MGVGDVKHAMKVWQALSEEDHRETLVACSGANPIDIWATGERPQMPATQHLTLRGNCRSAPQSNARQFFCHRKTPK